MVATPVAATVVVAPLVVATAAATPVAATVVMAGVAPLVVARATAAGMFLKQLLRLLCPEAVCTFLSAPASLFDDPVHV